MIIILLSAVCASCEKKKSWRKSPIFVIYTQFSKDVSFALKGVAFFSQLVTQASGTEQLILTSQGHWCSSPGGLLCVGLYVFLLKSSQNIW